MITLLAMGQKGLCVLTALIRKECKLDQVIIGRDKTLEYDFSAELEAMCRLNHINWTYRNDSSFMNSKYILAVSWRWMVSTQNNQYLIVFHDSLLPAMRGFNPLITGLIKGEEKFGVTALFGCKEYDSGPIIDQEIFYVTYPAKIQQVIELSLLSYRKLAYKIVDKLHRKEKIIGYPQDPKRVTYSLWRNEEDFYIDWNESSEIIKRTIDALGYPYSGAKTRTKDSTITIVDADTYEDVKIEIRQVGKVIFFRDAMPVIVCGDGLLQIKECNDDSEFKSITQKTKLY